MRPANLVAAALVLAGAVAQDSVCFSKKVASDCRAQFDAALGEGCVWCEAGAVPSECVPASWSKRLPPGVFVCDAAPATYDAFAGELAAEAEVQSSFPMEQRYHHHRQHQQLPQRQQQQQQQQRLHESGFGFTYEVREAINLHQELRAVMNKAPALFDKWAAANRREYLNQEEHAKRFANFRETLLTVAKHELAGDRSYRLELNKFADMSWEEFKATHLGVRSSQNCSATHKAGQLSNFLREVSSEDSAYSERVLEAARAVPNAVDWRERGAVSPVKNQGSCGSCWTFSTTGCLESHHFLRNDEMVLLSEQQLVDCAQAFDNHGCNGGLPSHAFEYIRYNKGLDTEAAYPYHAKDQASCAFIKKGVGATVKAAVNITYQREEELELAVGAVGPVSIAFQVTGDFKSYAGGVYDNPACGTQPDEVNHAVLAVGYGSEGGEDYWIVKNSWGEDWGLGGFFHMAKGKNMCGLADCASFPAV